MSEIEQAAPQPPAVADDVPESWNAAWKLARRIHNTPFVPKGLRGDGNAVMACILTGEEFGLGPMQSLRMINVIEGRPSLSAEMMRALVNRAGHRVDIVESKQDQVTITGLRRDTGAKAVVTWTLADAKRAGLTNNPAWTKYPRSMLLARATSELCRMLFPDVIGGLYTPEETAAITGHVYMPSAIEVEADPAPLVDPATGEILPDEEDLDAQWRAEADAAHADDAMDPDNPRNKP
jgi:hypothetical protein